MQQGNYKRHSSNMLGPGGWRCRCCTPPPGNRAKFKKQMRRIERVAQKRELEKNLNQDC